MIDIIIATLFISCSVSFNLKMSFPSRPSTNKKGVNVETFFCDNCGTEHIKWVGRCNACKEWNTVKLFNSGSSSRIKTSLMPLDTRTKTDNKVAWAGQQLMTSLIPMASINITEGTRRMKTASTEVNRVLGGGFVKGSVLLLAGEPGVGKSTLLLQIASNLVSISSSSTVLYVSGEETAEQIAMRANRLGLPIDNMYIMCEVDADRISETILEMEGKQAAPVLVIIDSIQTMYTSACPGVIGSVSQIRESAVKFVSLAKSTGCVVLLVGHVTKSGDVAGPRVLEHMVDTSLFLEGSESYEHRLLRGIKNRFGSTSEVGVLSMTASGLQDVSNPSELFMSNSVVGAGEQGSAVAVVLEGSRPLLTEVQSLVGSESFMKTPRRTSDGYSPQRLHLLCAVIEKKLRLKLWNREVYVNVIGGFRISDQCADLAVALTIVSSLLDLKITAATAFIGEVGLRGEIRGGRGIESRIVEASKMGFTRVIVPLNCGASKLFDKKKDIKLEIIECKGLEEALRSGLDCKDVDAELRNHRKKSSSGSGGRSKGYPPVSHRMDGVNVDSDEDDNYNNLTEDYLE